MNPKPDRPPLIIYHKADFDGIFCREIARQYFGDRAIYLGWDYGDPVPALEPGTQLYMLDISVGALMDWPSLIWIDHHKSAIEIYSPTIYGCRIDGVAACRLAWQWFHFDRPDKSAYVNRQVREPLGVRLAGEYDIWDRRDPRAELFQHGLRSQSLDKLWPELLSMDESGHSEVVTRLLRQGECLQFARAAENESIIGAYGFTVRWEGLCFLACNHARFNSQLFDAGLKPEHDALLGFNFNGREWRVSLYHAPGKEHHDLSLIAVKYGGGGHKGACGFRLQKPLIETLLSP